MKKLLSLTLATFTLAACGQAKTKKTETKKTAEQTGPLKKASDLFISVENEPLLAYATEYNSLETESPESNLLARELYKSALKYNFTLPGWPKNTEGVPAKYIMKDGKPSDGNFYDINRVTGTGAATERPAIAAKILKRWTDLKVDIGFIQTNPETKSQITNGQKLYDAVGEDGYTNKLVITGLNTSHVDLGDDKKGDPWSAKKNVATFEFSEIVTAYNAGYLTQTQFGKIKLKDGTWETRNVGYIVAAVKKDDKKTNVKNMKKANAFRQGVLDAVKEQQTGEAAFVDKKDASDKSKEKTLQFDSSDIKKYFEKLVKLETYKDKDRSITYYAGADADENSLVADQLFKVKVSNSQGHYLVVEKGGADSNDDPKGFGEEGDAKWSLGTGNSKVSTRVYMATQPWIKTRVKGDEAKNPDDIYTNWTSTEKYANSLAVEAVLSSLYGENKGKVEYFGRHTYIGSFPSFTRAGTNGVSDDDHKIDIYLLDKVRKELFAKDINVPEIEDKFLGSGL